MTTEYIIIIFIVGFIIAVFLQRLKRVAWKHQSYKLSLYQKKPYLFDTSSEYYFFKLVTSIMGPSYVLFPQINYSHLVVARTSSDRQDYRYRSHIDRKSADFVVCDKETCVPRLVINIDGSVHSLPRVKESDKMIDEVLASVGLPSVRISNEDSKNPEFVKTTLAKYLKF